MPIDDKSLLLERVLRWETERSTERFLVQPLGGGRLRDYSWGEAMDEARRMAQYLRSRGFPPGSRIAILSRNCAQFILADLAIWMAGHVSVALYPTQSAEMCRYILGHAEAKLLFVGKLDTWSELKAGVPSELPRVVCALSPQTGDPLWEEIVKQVEPLRGAPRRAPDDTALVIYTSGSTGKPKGVEHTFRSISAAAAGFCEVLHPGPGDRMLSYLPLAHAFERAAVEIIALYAPLELYFAESPDTFLADMKRARPTLFHSVPRLWLKFQQGVFERMSPARLAALLKIPIAKAFVKKQVRGGLGLDATRMAFSGSAPIPPELIEWYRDLGIELLEGYGMSENFSYSHLSLPGKTRVGFVGHALPGVHCELSPEGEVLVKSPANMKGYFKDPELTAASFTEERYLRTGDRGEIDIDGRLRITGRVKDLFKTSKGKYVAPVPIENLLDADARIEQSCVMGGGYPQPFAVVQLGEAARARLDDKALEQGLAKLLASVNRRLESQEHLAFLAVAGHPWLVENGLLTPSMKIRRSLLEARYEARADAWYAAGKPVVRE